MAVLSTLSMFITAIAALSSLSCSYNHFRCSITLLYHSYRCSNTTTAVISLKLMFYNSLQCFRFPTHNSLLPFVPSILVYERCCFDSFHYSASTTAKNMYKIVHVTAYFFPDPPPPPIYVSLLSECPYF
jgi:hypothetical protein